ncbi:MAG: PrsW family intramembrane metalloprotease [Chitinophagaceae bacterium]|nr:PrsW family intramembrane metalloprotease [Chitinophagaceae bacterium]
MQYIALAITPGIVISLYIFYKDSYNREPVLNLVVSFILGALSIIPVFFIERKAGHSFIDGSVMGVALFSFIVVALTEEAMKFIVVRTYAWNLKSFDEPLDGIVYTVMVGMGFATVENIMYVLAYADHGRGFEIGLKRMFLSVPAHATFAVVMGYFMGKARLARKHKLKFQLAGLLTAVFFHGTYDFFLYLNQFSMLGKTWSAGLLSAGAITSFLISLVLSRKLFNTDSAISARIFRKKRKKKINPQSEEKK